MAEEISRELIRRFQSNQGRENGVGDAIEHGESDVDDEGSRGSPEHRRRRTPAAVNGGQRWGNVPEREEEREGVGEMRPLTLKLMAHMRRPGTLHSHRNQRRTRRSRRR
jgi:hypothetical protein